MKKSAGAERSAILILLKLFKFNLRLFYSVNHHFGFEDYWLHDQLVHNSLLRP